MSGHLHPASCCEKPYRFRAVIRSLPGCSVVYLHCPGFTQAFPLLKGWLLSSDLKVPSLNPISVLKLAAGHSRASSFDRSTNTIKYCLFRRLRLQTYLPEESSCACCENSVKGKTVCHVADSAQQTYWWQEEEPVPLSSIYRQL